MVLNKWFTAVLVAKLLHLVGVGVLHSLGSVIFIGNSTKPSLADIESVESPPRFLRMKLLAFADRYAVSLGKSATTKPRLSPTLAELSPALNGQLLKC